MFRMSDYSICGLLTRYHLFEIGRPIMWDSDAADYQISGVELICLEVLLRLGTLATDA